MVLTFVEAKVLPPLLFPGKFWVLILFVYFSVLYLSIFLFSCLLNIIVVLTLVLLLFALLLPPDQVLSLPMSAGGTPTNTNDPPTITSLPETYFLHLLHGADVFFHCSFKMCLIFVTFLFT